MSWVLIAFTCIRARMWNYKKVLNKIRSLGVIEIYTIIESNNKTKIIVLFRSDKQQVQFNAHNRFILLKDVLHALRTD